MLRLIKVATKLSDPKFQFICVVLQPAFQKNVAGSTNSSKVQLFLRLLIGLLPRFQVRWLGGPCETRKNKILSRLLKVKENM